jgi:hypothetical protein
VEVGDVPVLESIFMIFGRSYAICAENETLRTIWSRNEEKWPKVGKLRSENAHKHMSATSADCADRLLRKSGSRGAVRRSSGEVIKSVTFGVSSVAISL